VKRILGEFGGGVVRLAFRLLPREGAAPWAATAVAPTESYKDSVIEKFKKPKKPWFDKKGAHKEQVDDAVDDVLEAWEALDDDLLVAVDGDDAILDAVD